MPWMAIRIRQYIEDPTESGSTAMNLSATFYKAHSLSNYNKNNKQGHAYEEG
jgi:hypothetical protein